MARLRAAFDSIVPQPRTSQFALGLTVLGTPANVSQEVESPAMMKVSRVRRRAAAADWVASVMALTFIALVVLWPASAAAQSMTVDRDIALMQKILKQHPDAELYYRLSDLYIQKGRQTGDITYFNLATNSLHEALRLQPELEPAHRHLAFVLYSLHDFAGATSEATRAIQLDSRDSYAYGVLGDAQLETGQYQKAAGTYEQMAAIKTDLYSYSRRSGLETIMGENDVAIADLKRAIAAGIQTGEPAEGVAWAQVMLAQDYFLLGRLDDAYSSGAAALATYPAYHRALAVLGQIRAAQEKFDEAAGFYLRAIAVIPLPEYAAALSDVYVKLGRQKDADEQRRLVEFIARLNTLNRVLYNRVLVDYYADHDIEHQRAVELAAGEFQIRRDIYGDDALAWALYRAGKADAALPHIVSALRFKTSDARLYFHAGMIYAALGQNHLARGMLKQALAINPRFQPVLDEVAEREYAALNRPTAPQLAEEGEPQH
jgi:tetratricopeptide (TPR) repeat protein